MNFSNYFDKWLYGDHGYYTKYKEIGKKGDFFTAVSTSSLFGGSIAKRLIDTIENGYLSNDTCVLEIGAHHGYLLADIIQFIYTLKPKYLKTLKFAIVERFDFLQKKQKEYIKECFGDQIKLIHYKSIECIKLENSFIVANEIFDAFSCEVVYTNKNKKLQLAKVKNHKISFEDCKDKSISRYCKKYNITKGEVAIGYEEFANTLSKNIKKFEFITFDYGEKYPRNDFSIRVYKDHKVYPIFDKDLNLKELFSNSDITYDVNFTHLIESFENSNIKNVEYSTQLKALVKFGIIDLLEILYQNVNEEIYLKESNRVKILLEPTGMGDRFKVAIFRKE